MTDWARLLVNSSNWLFITFPSFVFLGLCDCFRFRLDWAPQLLDRCLGASKGALSVTINCGVPLGDTLRRIVVKAVMVTDYALVLTGLCSARQPETGQRHASESDAKFLQRRAARDRLGQAFG